MLSSTNRLIDSILAKSTILILGNATLNFLATLAGWMNRKQQKVIEYLLEENSRPRAGLSCGAPAQANADSQA